MKLKKLISVCLLAGMINSTAYAEENVRIYPSYDGNVISFELGTGAGEGDVVTVTVIRKGDEAVSSNAYTVRELKADADGNVKFEFEMPEFKNEVRTDGEYILSLKADGRGKKVYEYTFISQGTKDSLCELLAEADKNTVADILSGDSEYYDAIESTGINFSIYNSLDKDICGEFADADKTAENVIEVLKRIIGAQAVKEKYSPISDVFVMVNPAYGETSYENVTDEEFKSYIDLYFEENRSDVTYKNFDNEYEVANVLYKINNARYNELEKLMKDNEELLDLDGDNGYEDYLDLSSSKKTKTHEEMVRTLKNTKVVSISDLKNLIDDSLPSESSKKGSSGGGGGGGSSSAVTDFKVSVVEPEETKEDVKEETETFADMGNHSWATVAVYDLYNKGIVSGVGDGRFEPSRNVTREEFVAMLVRAYNITPGGENIFEDVPADSWYEEYVNAAYAKGIVNGVSETLFGTGSYITRQDMITMIARLTEAGVAERSVDELSDFDTVSDYAKDAVKKLYESGIVSGVGGGMISPLANTTRAEAAQIIYNVLNQ